MPLKDAIQQHLQAIRQHFFRQNSMNQDSSKFNNAKVSGFMVASYIGSYIEISGKNAWVHENLNTDIQFLKNS